MNRFDDFFHRINLDSKLERLAYFISLGFIIYFVLKILQLLIKK
jgi:hypothetical protein